MDGSSSPERGALSGGIGRADVGRYVSHGHQGTIEVPAAMWHEHPDRPGEMLPGTVCDLFTSSDFAQGLESIEPCFMAVIRGAVHWRS